MVNPVVQSWNDRHFSRLQIASEEKTPILMYAGVSPKLIDLAMLETPYVPALGLDPD